MTGDHLTATDWFILVYTLFMVFIGYQLGKGD